MNQSRWRRQYNTIISITQRPIFPVPAPGAQIQDEEAEVVDGSWYQKLTA